VPPWITASSLHDFYIKDSDRKITPLGADNGTRMVPKDTILFVVRGMSLKTEFRVGITTREMAFGQDCKALIVKDGINPLFLANALRARQTEILGLSDEASHGTGRLATEAIQSLMIPLPPLAEQNRIAEIAGALDRKIELNRQMNQTLEAMAQAIFQSWFVDFEPVKAKQKAKAAGKSAADIEMAAIVALSGKSEESIRELGEEARSGLAEMAGLFGDELMESELGLIPEGWKIRKIEDVVERVVDGPHATPKEAEEGPVFLGVKNFTGTSLDLSSLRKISETDWLKWTQRITPQVKDIVFTYEATLGFFSLIPSWLRCCLGRRIALIRTNLDNKDTYFLFHTFTAMPFQTFLESRVSHGSTVNRILISDFPKYPILYPPDDLAQHFSKTVEGLWELIHMNQKQNQDLAELRDSLLPKLLSGELTLPAAQTQATEALVP
jgi:type I restriction enzyme, S subunit